jgi:hypothetical protein
MTSSMRGPEATDTTDVVGAGGDRTREPRPGTVAGSPSAAPAPPGERRADPVLRGLRWWREVIYIIVIYLAYSSVRNLFGSGDGGPSTAGPAYDNAVRIIDIQRWMGLYFEPDVQDWYLGLPADGFIRLWNIFYGLAHFVVPSLVLIWLFRRFPTRYRVWRNTLALTTILALVGFASFPLMPPRLMDDPGIYGGCQIYAEGEVLPEQAGEAPCDRYGFVDTIAVHGGWASFGSDEMASVSNQFAAMPSMHIGWSTWVLLTVVPLARRWWSRALAVAYPMVTLWVIVVTGNHFWLDAVGGLACLAAGYALCNWATRRYESRLAGT